MANAHGPYGSLSYKLYHAQDIGPKSVTNQELFVWCQRAKALEDQVAKLTQDKESMFRSFTEDRD